MQPNFNDANVIEVDYVHVLGLREDRAININYKNPALAGSPRVLSAAFTAAGLPVLSTITDLTSSARSRYDGFNVSTSAPRPSGSPPDLSRRPPW